MAETVMRMGSVSIIRVERINTTSMKEVTVGKGSAVRYRSLALGDSLAIAAIFRSSNLLGRLSRIPSKRMVTTAVPMAAL